MNPTKTTPPASAAQPACSGSSERDCYHQCGQKVLSSLARFSSAPASTSEALFAFAHCCMLGLGFRPFCSSTGELCAADASTLPNFAAPGAQGGMLTARYRFIGHGFTEKPTITETHFPPRQQERIGKDADAPALTQAQAQSKSGSESDFKSDRAMTSAPAGGAMAAHKADIERHGRRAEGAVCDVVLEGRVTADGLALSVNEGAAALQSQQEQYSQSQSWGMSSSSSYSSSSRRRPELALRAADWLAKDAAGRPYSDAREMFINADGLCKTLNEGCFQGIIPDKVS